MVKVNPFPGITYDFSKVEAAESVIAPPYDVISPAYQDELYERSDFNIVRLILGKQFPTDDKTNNRYTRAAAEMKKWLQEGVLAESDEPKLYYYIQQYKDAKGENVTRKGFIGRCYIEDFEAKQILPHEETMGGPKEDRFNLTMATKTNLSQVFGIYSDPEKKVDKTLEEALPEKPLLDVTDEDDVRHVFYEVSDAEAIKSVKALMDDKNVLIADGHHRYETALKYRNTMREQVKDDPSEEIPYNSVMMYFANMDDDGLRLYPTHRVLKKPVDCSLGELKSKLEPYFTIEEKDFEEINECFRVVESLNPAEFPIGIVGKDEPGTLYIIKPNIEKVVTILASHGVPELVARLDTTILHRFILEHLMHLDMLELKDEGNISFERDEQQIIEKYNTDMPEYIFLVGTPLVSVIKDVCLAGYRMPQKSTYFYPKLLSGLVINPLS